MFRVDRQPGRLTQRVGGRPAEAVRRPEGEETDGEAADDGDQGCVGRVQPSSHEAAFGLRRSAPLGPEGRADAFSTLAPLVKGEGESVGTAVLGAGPAGLTAAYVLALRGRPGAVYEADGTVGGLAKTVEFDGYRFDIGGHRFFTKLAPIRRLWEEMLGDELLTRPRLSRIYYHGQFMHYPLVAKDVVKRLGIRESFLCTLSYLWSRIKPKPDIVSFEDWVTFYFGKRQLGVETLELL